MKTNLFLISSLILLSSLATAQQVSNIDFTQEGKTIKITYDLLGESSQSYEVKVWYTTDEGQNWHGPLQYVSGDVGKNQKPGYTKTIIWDMLKEVDKLTAYIDFQIEAVNMLNIPEMVFVQGGTYYMGSTDGGDDEKPVHKVTLDDFFIGKYEVTHEEYLREVGESQDATKQKDAAFAEIDDWMRDFYAVARIALEDHPQLLETLGILVRS